MGETSVDMTDHQMSFVDSEAAQVAKFSISRNSKQLQSALRRLKHAITCTCFILVISASSFWASVAQHGRNIITRFHPSLSVGLQVTSRSNESTFRATVSHGRLRPCTPAWRTFPVLARGVARSKNVGWWTRMASARSASL